MNKILEDVYNRKLDKVGEVVVKAVKKGFDTAVAGSSKIVDTVYYEIDSDNTLLIKGSPVITYIDKGTKPYEIRAKPGKALKFKSFGKNIGKTGKVYNDGDNVIVKKVNHPGIDARAFMEASLFMARRDILNSFKTKQQLPPLTFLSEGDKLYHVR